jgi:hypothetical protein
VTDIAYVSNVRASSLILSLSRTNNFDCFEPLVLNR